MRRLARLATAVVAAATPVLGLATPSFLLPSAAADSSTVDAVRLNGFEARLVNEINDARRNAGLGALHVTPGTTDVARRWSWHLAGSQVLGHNPSLVNDIAGAGSAAWSSIAENVGYGPAQDPHALFVAYMHSPEHRANILDHSARYLGVGVVERNGMAWNTLDFTNAYSTSYGPTRVPAAGLTMDETSINATTDVATFDSHLDQRVTSRSHGSVHASRIAFTGPTASNGSAYTVLRTVRRGQGRGLVVMRDALDLTHATGLTLQLRARDPRGHKVPVKVVLRRSFGNSIGVGTATVGGHTRWLDLPLPEAARTFRDELVLRVPAKAVRAAGGRVRLDVFDVRATA
jgi:uncharacterized protein YkwD